VFKYYGISNSCKTIWLKFHKYNLQSFSCKYNQKLLNIQLFFFNFYIRNTWKLFIILYTMSFMGNYDGNHTNILYGTLSSYNTIFYKWYSFLKVNLGNLLICFTLYLYNMLNKFKIGKIKLEEIYCKTQYAT